MSATGWFSFAGDPGRRGRRALTIGVAGLAVAAVLGMFQPRMLLEGWLAAACAWVAVPVGALGIAMTHRLSGGEWGRAIGAELDGAIRTLPLAALSFLPVLAGVSLLYPWAGVDAGTPDIASRQPYLAPWFFAIRTAISFAVWMLLAVLVMRGGRAGETSMRQRPVAAVGLVLMAVTVHFAAIDWMMTLEPRFNSSIFGLIFINGFLESALAFAIAVSLWAPPEEEIQVGTSPGGAAARATAARGDVPGGLGGLLLGTVLLWIYLAFSQYLIIWSADIPDEAVWYLERAGGLWLAVLWAIALLLGAVPFLALVITRVRQRRRRLVPVAVLVFVMRLVETLWFTLPAFPDSGWYQALIGAAATVGLGGLWFAAFFWLIAGERPAQEAVELEVDHG